MKNIAVWKVVLLTLITGGLYAIFWAGRNRDYLAKQKNVTQKLPSWIWLLLIPFALVSAIVGAFVIYIVGSSGALSAEATSLGVELISLGVEVVVLLVGLWWLWYFGKAFAMVTQGRMSRAVTLVLYFFAGPFVIAFQQFYINRLDRNKKGQTYKTSAGLLALVCVVAVLSIFATVASFYSLEESSQQIEKEILTTQESIQKIEDETEVTEAKAQEVEDLDNKYTSCIADLDKTYPEEEVLSDEESTAYMEAFDACDAIYKEYEAAYDAYVAE